MAKHQVNPGIPKVKKSGYQYKKKAGMGTHPAHFEYEYQPDEMEFMRAIEEWKTKTGRKFPRWVEVLAVLKSIGYAKREMS